MVQVIFKDFAERFGLNPRLWGVEPTEEVKALTYLKKKQTRRQGQGETGR